MNRINQQLGQIKWFADHIQLLQSEPLKALDALLAHFPSCVVSGCEVDGTTVKAGLISFVWTDTGVKHSMIVPFDGANDVVFPKYFVLQKTDVMRFYENGGSKVFSENYKAVLSDTASTPSLQIIANGTVVRLLDAIQSSLYRLVTDSEKTTWNAKIGPSTYTAADIVSKLLTVDGAGSGLDADMLDGYQAAAFALLAGCAFTGLVTANNGLVTDIGAISMGSEPSFYPFGLTSCVVDSTYNWPVSYGILITFKINVSGSIYAIQLLLSTTTPQIFKRYKITASNSWGNLIEVSNSSPKKVAVVSQTIDESFANCVIMASGTITITIPSGMPLNMRFDIINDGGGIITISAPTLRCKNSANKLISQYSGASLYNSESNIWYAVGDLST